MTPRERILAAVAPYLAAHAVTGPFAVGETRWEVSLLDDNLDECKPYLSLVFGWSSTPVFPNERFAKMALLAALEVWLAIQAEEIELLAQELNQATFTCPCGVIAQAEIVPEGWYFVEADDPARDHWLCPTCAARLATLAKESDG